VFNPQPIKKRKKKAKYPKKAKAPENYLQAQVNSMLEWMNIKYIRIPDLIGRLCSRYSPLKPWEKEILSDAFKGAPDNILMIPINDRYFLGLNIELKSEVGTLSKGQRDWKKEVPVTVCRDLGGVQKALKDLLGMVDHLNTNMALKGPEGADV